MPKKKKSNKKLIFLFFKENLLKNPDLKVGKNNKKLIYRTNFGGIFLNFD